MNGLPVTFVDRCKQLKNDQLYNAIDAIALFIKKNMR